MQKPRIVRAIDEAFGTLLNKGDQYVRYWPFIPSEAIQATCVTLGDLLSVEIEPSETPTTQGH